MEVTKENFDEALEIVTEAILDADFMAFDTEFTGFSIMEEDQGHDYDSIEDRYQKLKYVGERGRAIQFGLTTYKWNKQSKEYIAQCFNFYLLKSPDSIDDRAITMKADGVNFLAQNGFDFSKLYSSGITYERLSIRETLLSAWKRAKNDGENKLNKEKKKQKVLSRVNAEKKHFYLEEIDKMVYSRETKIEFDFDSYLLKQELAKSIKQGYPGLMVSFQKSDTSFKVFKSENFIPPHRIVTSIQDDLIDKEEEKTGTSDNSDELNIK